VTVLDNDAIGGGGGVTYFGGIGGNDADGEGGGIFVDLDTILQAVGCSITGILRSAATPRKSIPKSMARSAPDECRPRIAPASHPISLSRATAGLALRASGIDHSPS
jgi:hypothetical protein